MKVERKRTREVKVGSLKLGGGNPIAVQSMTKTSTRDYDATLNQVRELLRAGCDIVRISVPDRESLSSFAEIRKEVSAPLVADIHFDYKLALGAIEAGADKLRINPGNIGGKEKIRELVEAARTKNIPIRIGVNAGSLEREVLEKHGKPCPEALVESAINNVKILEESGFGDIVVSLKSSDVVEMIEAYRLFSEEVDYPLHLGLTEGGPPFSGTVRSSIALGILLNEGIGDTIRVSLTGNPVEEIRVGKEILRSIGCLKDSPRLISCPTCARCGIDLESIALEVERGISSIRASLVIAIMGCAVNGPGEAKMADIGIVGGKGDVLLYKKGMKLNKVKEKDAAGEVLRLALQMAEETVREGKPHG